MYPPPSGCSGMLIDATRKGPYPPVGLPKRPYMEKALEIWQGEGLPPLKLKKPWYGYALGLWPDENEELAQCAVNGDYFEVSKKAKR